MPNPLEDLTGKNVIVDGVPMPDRKVVQFVAGEGMDIDATDDSVNGRTVITLTSTGGEGGGTVTGTPGTADQFALWTGDGAELYARSIDAEDIPFDDSETAASGSDVSNIIIDLDSIVQGKASSAALAALTAADIAFDDTNALTGETDVQAAMDVIANYQEDLLNGQVIATSGTPAYVSGYSVIRPRTQDGAVTTRLAANSYRAEKVAAPVTTTTATTTTLASLYLESNTTAVVAVAIHAHETSTLANGADAFCRLVVSVDGSGVVTVSSTRSTYATPDALPVATPAWIGSNYASFITTTASANTLNVRVITANTTSVSWVAMLDALVSGA
jgi:hypothetical protein